MKSATESTDGILNAWEFACEIENIDPENPSRIPKIFAIDSKLNIKNSFHYVFDCSNNINSGKYCVTHIANQYEESRRSSGGGCSSCCGGGD